VRCTWRLNLLIVDMIVCKVTPVILHGLVSPERVYRCMPDSSQGRGGGGERYTPPFALHAPIRATRPHTVGYIGACEQEEGAVLETLH